MTSLAIFLELCNGSQRFCQKEKPLLSPLQCWRTEKEPWTQIRTWFQDRPAVLAALGWRMVLFLFFMEEKLRPREMKTCPRQDRELGAKPSRMLSSLLSSSLGSWNSQVQCGEVGLQKLWDSGFLTEQEDSRLSNDSNVSVLGRWPLWVHPCDRRTELKGTSLICRWENGGMEVGTQLGTHRANSDTRLCPGLLILSPVLSKLECHQKSIIFLFW